MNKTNLNPPNTDRSQKVPYDLALADQLSRYKEWQMRSMLRPLPLVVMPLTTIFFPQINRVTRP